MELANPSYGNVELIPFTVRVNACNPVIDTSDVSIPHYYQAWGADAISLPEASTAFSQFYFSPACDYTFTYTVYQVAPNGAPLSLPTEISFNPSINSFSVEKCSASTFADDADCQFPWTDTTWRIAITGTLDN